MNKKGGTYLIFSVVVLALIIIFRPVPEIQEDQALVHSAKVIQISEAGQKDVLFSLEDGLEFYINRGLAKGLSLDSLQDLYLGKELEFKYPDFWSPLHTSTSAKHAYKVRFDTIVIYNEFKEEI